MEPNEVQPRAWHQRRQSLRERQRRHHHASGAVAPGSPELQQRLSGGVGLYPSAGQCRTGDVEMLLLQRPAVVSAAAHGSMQAETVPQARGLRRVPLCGPDRRPLGGEIETAYVSSRSKAPVRGPRQQTLGTTSLQTQPWRHRLASISSRQCGKYICLECTAFTAPARRHPTAYAFNRGLTCARMCICIRRCMPLSDPRSCLRCRAPVDPVLVWAGQSEAGRVQIGGPAGAYHAPCQSRRVLSMLLTCPVSSRWPGRIAPPLRRSRPSLGWTKLPSSP